MNEWEHLGHGGGENVSLHSLFSWFKTEEACGKELVPSNKAYKANQNEVLNQNEVST